MQVAYSTYKSGSLKQGSSSFNNECIILLMIELYVPNKSCRIGMSVMIDTIESHAILGVLGLFIMCC